MTTREQAPTAKQSRRLQPRAEYGPGRRIWTGVQVHQWLVTRNPGLAARVVFTTGGAFGDATAQYLVDCGAPKLDKPFDTGEFKRVVLARIQAAKNGPNASVGEAGGA